MVEIERIYTCIICARAWDNIQSLRAHMKVHKGEYKRTSIYVRPENWDKFEETCKKHKTTTCHVLDALTEAVIQADDTNLIDLAKLASPNPLFISMTHIFSGVPHSPLKVDITEHIGKTQGCLVCGSRTIQKRGPNKEGYIEVTCLECKSEALIRP